MKLGIFDSGLGGIMIAKAIHQAIPDIDKVYLGDTLNLPYGGRSEEAIYAATLRCMENLFQKGCKLIIIACNTASARALRRLQQEFLPIHYPDRRILGVVVPTIEEAIDSGYQSLGVIGTNYTIGSHIYMHELHKINPSMDIYEQSTPLLVPLIEHNGEPYVDQILDDYLSFCDQKNLDALLLGCTHYIRLKEKIRDRYPFAVMAQDEIIPQKLIRYFDRHPDIFNVIDCNSRFDFYLTDYTEEYASNAQKLFGQNIHVEFLPNVHNA